MDQVDTGEVAKSTDQQPEKVMYSIELPEVVSVNNVGKEATITDEFSGQDWTFSVIEASVFEGDSEVGSAALQFTQKRGNLVLSEGKVKPDGAEYTNYRYDPNSKLIDSFRTTVNKGQVEVDGKKLDGDMAAKWASIVNGNISNAVYVANKAFSKQ